MPSVLFWAGALFVGIIGATAGKRLISNMQESYRKGVGWD